MKLVTFDINTPVGPVQRIGALLEGRVVDLSQAYACHLAETGDTSVDRAYEVAAALLPPSDMVAFLSGGKLSMDAAKTALEHARRHGGSPESIRAPKGGRPIFALSEVRLRAPIPRPTSLRDGWLYEEHAKNAMRKAGKEVPELWYKIPAYYRTSHTNVVGPDDPIIWPNYTEKLDYELELACVIGKEGVNIPKERANEYIAGYTIYNDVSLRDYQFYEMGLGLGPNKGKNFVNCNIMGPCIVTPDEFDPTKAKMYARCNGEVWSENVSGGMQFSFQEVIEYMTREEPVYPGEIIGSGTVGGGCSLEHDRWLKPGDVLELEIEGIGILRNPVTRPR